MTDADDIARRAREISARAEQIAEDSSDADALREELDESPRQDDEEDWDGAEIACRHDGPHYFVAFAGPPHHMARGPEAEAVCPPDRRGPKSPAFSFAAMRPAASW